MGVKEKPMISNRYLRAEVSCARLMTNLYLSSQENESVDPKANITASKHI